ncbi:SDR family oxidoreductase [Acidocella sp.]|uniref:SDR family oxidoreductase n=1 Tax=Acidocella sp. TaxID=50710 RepID=UPI00260469DC|nr:SDR family oxidoreductase [Acidocella sp.]
MAHIIGSSDRPDLPLAVVVGAGGLGMAVARRLGLGYRVMLADRDAEHLAARVEALRHEGHDAVGIPCDVTELAAVSALTAHAAAAGPVRALAHIVGLSPSMAGFKPIMEVNLVGAARIAEAFRPVMPLGGAALFISSSAAHMSPVPDQLWPLLENPLSAGFADRMATVLGEGATPKVAYALSKAGLNRLCQRAAAAWGARGLRILSLSPGLIATPMGAQEFERSPAKHRLLAAVPLAREGTMLEIANLAAFLISDQASFISGTDILADGGMVAALRHVPGG